MQKRRQTYVPPYNFATIYLGMRDTEKTLKWVERTCDERDVRMVFLGVDPGWDTLRSDPRFQKLLRRAGFA